VIHAHDWLTYPAGLALAQVTGKPLVVHVHSTEFDRSGSNVNQRVYDIERAGMHGGRPKVIAVSQLTQDDLHERGTACRRTRWTWCTTAWTARRISRGGQRTIEAGDKIVLFLGRITMQKGPEYFIAAAKRVLEKMPNVKFVSRARGTWRCG
jgi:glycogen(starch) synthase